VIRAAERPPGRLAVAAPPAAATGLRAPSRLPETALLLTGGGDTRITLDPRSAANKYGCPPLPAPAFAAFGSSTASTISSGAFAAADELRARLDAAASLEPAAVTYARELQRMRHELRSLCGLGDQNIDIIFGASGTDLHLIAAELIRTESQRPPLVVMVDAAETGSGVPAALAGRYFSAVAPLGDKLAEGAAALTDLADIVAIPTREVDGRPRPAAAIDADVTATVADAVAQGRQILVTMVDVSKTGLIAPGPACAAALRRLWPDQVQVLVDACQFRLAPATLRAYLGAQCVVAVTGSKFLTGPAFSGALLVPASVASRWQRHALPPALRAFSARGEWPLEWPAARELRDAVNYGLLLRWEAALHELRAFRAVPEPLVAEILSRFAAAVEWRLADDPSFERLPTPALDRGDVGTGQSWDRIPTIFPFLLRRGVIGRKAELFDREETARLHSWLAIDMAARLGIGVGHPSHATLSQVCQFGQPVPCGVRDGAPLAALRLCASARLVVEAAACGPAGIDRLIVRSMKVLDKAAFLTRHVPPSAGAPVIDDRVTAA
jgi:hypothetical protein